jgi:hypothetical protein
MRTIYRVAGFLTAAAATIGTLAFSSLAQAEEAAPSAGSLVEDFSYPGATEIEKLKNIKLISGDGHITLEDCTSDDQLIRVESYNNVKETTYCFKVHGTTGLLRLEIPKVYFVWAGDEAVTAQVTVNGVKEDPIKVAAGDGEPVGAADPKNHAVLLELKV